MNIEISEKMWNFIEQMNILCETQKSCNNCPFEYSPSCIQDIWKAKQHLERNKKFKKFSKNP